MLSNNLPDGLTLTEKFVLLIFNIICELRYGKKIRLRILQGGSDA